MLFLTIIIVCFSYSYLTFVALINNKNTLNKEHLPFVKENYEEDAGFLMLQISNLWKDYRSKALKKHYGLTHVQYAALAGIYWFTLHNKEPVTQTLLSKYARIDPMTLSHVFKGLEAKGYISRITHPTDIRAKAITLTSAGEELMRQAVRTIMETDQKFFKILGSDTGQFNECLKKLLKTNN